MRSRATGLGGAFVAASVAFMVGVGPAASRARAGDDPARLAEAVRAAESRSEKQAAARRLAAVGTDESKKALLALFADETDTATQRAAELALVTLEDAAVDATLSEKLEQDVLGEAEIVAALRARKSPFPTARLLARLNEATVTLDQNYLLDLLGRLGSAPAREALASVVRAKGKDQEPLRARALGALATAGKGDELRRYALEFLGDPDPAVAGGAVALLVETGSNADLPRILEILSKRTADADAPIAAVAYRGVAKWADAKVKLATLLAALRHTDERRAQAAIPVFADVGGAEVEEQLERLVRRGTQQETRLGAADRLVAWPAVTPPAPDRVVPYLIPVLGETYQPAKDEDGGIVGSFFKGLANIITLGTIDALEAWHRHQTKAAFEASQRKVAEALAKRTGADPGATHEAWVDWAVDKGYTVEGDNLVARLFSGYPERRRRAHDSAARLLGFTGQDDLVKKTPALAGAKEGEIGLDLARRLLAKGLPVDEKH